jgi:hypothetical protein
MNKAIKNFGGAEELGGEMRKVYKRGTWGEALLAALPYLLFALTVEASSLLYYYGPRRPLRLRGQPIAFAFALLCLGMTLYGLRRRSPPWLYQWLGYGFFLWIMVVPWVLLKPTDIPTRRALSDVSCGVWLIVFMAMLAFAARRDRLYASFAAFPSATMVWALMSLDEVYPSVEAPLYIGAGLVAALASIVFIKAQSSRARLGVLLMANAVIITPITYAAIFHTDYPMLLVLFPPEPAPLSVMVSMVLALGLTSMLLLGPPMVLTFVNKAKQLAKR